MGGPGPAMERPLPTADTRRCAARRGAPGSTTPTSSGVSAASGRRWAPALAMLRCHLASARTGGWPRFEARAVTILFYVLRPPLHHRPHRLPDGAPPTPPPTRFPPPLWELLDLDGARNRRRPSRPGRARWRPTILRPRMHPSDGRGQYLPERESGVVGRTLWTITVRAVVSLNGISKTASSIA